MRGSAYLINLRIIIERIFFTINRREYRDLINHKSFMAFDFNGQGNESRGNPDRATACAYRSELRLLMDVYGKP